MRLPSSRIAECSACLTAVHTLIDRLAGFVYTSDFSWNSQISRSDAVMSPLYTQLVLLHPTLVELIPCSHIDSQV